MSYTACTCIQVLSFLNNEQIDREFSHLGLELEEDANLLINVDLKRELIKAKLQSMMDNKCLDLIPDVASPMNYNSDYDTISRRSADCSCTAIEDALDEIVQKLEILGKQHSLCQTVHEKMISLNETFLNLNPSNSRSEYLDETPTSSATQNFLTTSFLSRSYSGDIDGHSESNEKGTIYRSSSWSLPFSSPSTSEKTSEESLSSHLAHSTSQNFSLSHISSITGLDRDYEQLESFPNVPENGDHHYEPLSNCMLERNSMFDVSVDTPHYELPQPFSNSRTLDNSVEEAYSLELEYWSYVRPNQPGITRIKSMPNLENFISSPRYPRADINNHQSVSHVSRICTERESTTNYKVECLPSNPGSTCSQASSSSSSESSSTSSSGSPENNDRIGDLKDLDISTLRQQFARKRLSSIFERGLIEMEKEKKRDYWLRLKLRRLKRVSTCLNELF